MNSPLNDFRVFLKEELQRRASKNPAYSLRAFARDIGLTNSHLSMTLSGRKRISAETAEQIAQRMNLKTGEAEYVVLLAQKQFEQPLVLRNIIDKRMEELRGQVVYPFDSAVPAEAS